SRRSGRRSARRSSPPCASACRGVDDHPVSQARRVFAVGLRNRELRRVELAFLAFNAAEWAVWIAMLVYAYGRGGATTAGLVALAQLAPAALVGPAAAALGDRHPPGRVLAVGYALQAAAMAATGAVMLAG